VELRCLFLQNNAIGDIKGLEALTDLRTLNLSSNLISNIPKLDYLPQLSSLDLSRNLFAKAEDLEGLVGCTNLRCGVGLLFTVILKLTKICISVLDLSNNRLAGEDVIEVFSRMTGLVSLIGAEPDIISANPVTRRRFFR